MSSAATATSSSSSAAATTNKTPTKAVLTSGVCGTCSYRGGVFQCENKDGGCKSMICVQCRHLCETCREYVCGACFTPCVFARDGFRWHVCLRCEDTTTECSSCHSNVCGDCCTTCWECQGVLCNDAADRYREPASRCNRRCVKASSMGNVCGHHVCKNCVGKHEHKHVEEDRQRRLQAEEDKVATSSSTPRLAVTTTSTSTFIDVGAHSPPNTPIPEPLTKSIATKKKRCLEEYIQLSCLISGLSTEFDKHAKAMRETADNEDEDLSDYHLAVEASEQIDELKEFSKKLKDISKRIKTNTHDIRSIERTNES